MPRKKGKLDVYQLSHLQTKGGKIQELPALKKNKQEASEIVRQGNPGKKASTRGR